MVRLVRSQENRFTPESPGNKARRLKGASLQDLQGMQPVVLHLRALQDGVDRDAVNAAMNDNDPKSALIRLIMQEAELSRAHQRNVGVQQSEVQRLPAAPTTAEAPRPAKATLAFGFFCKDEEVRSRVRQALPPHGMDEEEDMVKSQLSEAWGEMTPEQRQPFVDLQDVDKARHKAEMAAWTQQSKAERMRLVAHYAVRTNESDSSSDDEDEVTAEEAVSSLAG